VLVRNRKRLLVDNQGGADDNRAPAGSKVGEVEKIATDSARNLAGSSPDR
jgi:hypothetical protein